MLIPIPPDDIALGTFCALADEAMRVVPEAAVTVKRTPRGGVRCEYSMLVPTRAYGSTAPRWDTVQFAVVISGDLPEAQQFAEADRLTKIMAEHALLSKRVCHRRFHLGEGA